MSSNPAPKRELRRIAVFCGASPGATPEYAELARQLGEEMVRRKIGLVYGGGNVGLMGVIAHTVAAGLGEENVLGVIPESLAPREVREGPKGPLKPRTAELRSHGTQGTLQAPPTARPCWRWLAVATGCAARATRWAPRASPQRCSRCPCPLATADQRHHGGGDPRGGHHAHPQGADVRGGRRLHLHPRRIRHARRNSRNHHLVLVQLARLVAVCFWPSV